jgi:hypothetical protein
MSHLVKISISLLLALAFCSPLRAAAAEDYFTEAELDLIRAAQELRHRVPAYFKLAERRLIFLGVMEKSEKEIENERKAREKREKELKKNPKAQLPPVDELAYLDEFTPAELLRGYVQALQEVMANIDDAYERRGDVRDALEDLEKFTGDTLPLLEKYRPRNSSDRAALDAAIEKAKEAQTDTRAALKIVPKTEKKRAQ